MMEWMIIVVVAIMITEKVCRRCFCCDGKRDDGVDDNSCCADNDNKEGLPTLFLLWR